MQDDTNMSVNQEVTTILLRYGWYTVFICAFITAVGAGSTLLFHPDELQQAVRLYGATGSLAVFGYLSMRAAESIRNLYIETEKNK